MSHNKNAVKHILSDIAKIARDGKSDIDERLARIAQLLTIANYLADADFSKSKSKKRKRAAPKVDPVSTPSTIDLSDPKKKDD